MLINQVLISHQYSIWVFCETILHVAANYKQFIRDTSDKKVLENTSLAAKGALAHRLHRRTACNAAPPAKSKRAARGPQNGRWGLERW